MNAMQINLNLERTADQNASAYFERAKKVRKKIIGAAAAVDETKRKLEKADFELRKESAQRAPQRRREWYEKFRWFFSSEGFLVLGGRDATSNEVLIKKHTDPDDIVFHTDIAGSPFFVIKTGSKSPGEATMEEASIATASYSRAWKLGYTETPAFHVRPDQVSKKAQSGEFLGKGAFMIYGKTAYIKNRMELAIGIKEGVVIGGPLASVKAHAEKFMIIMQGDVRQSEAAKKIRRFLGLGDLDDIIRFLPSGPVRIIGK
jgi:predicted ribosome quality control (RQC) complex YloA/Tae2 family protein